MEQFVQCISFGITVTAQEYRQHREKRKQTKQWHHTGWFSVPQM